MKAVLQIDPKDRKKKKTAKIIFDSSGEAATTTQLSKLIKVEERRVHYIDSMKIVTITNPLSLTCGDNAGPTNVVKMVAALQTIL